jgi:hypothetical protein
MIEKHVRLLSNYLIKKELKWRREFHPGQRQGNRVYIIKTLAVHIIDSKIIFFQLVVQSHPSYP